MFFAGYVGGERARSLLTTPAQCAVDGSGPKNDPTLKIFRTDLAKDGVSLQPAKVGHLVVRLVATVGLQRAIGRSCDPCVYSLGLRGCLRMRMKPPDFRKPRQRREE